MKVLMTADAVGGVWTFALDLIRALGDRADFILAIEGGHPDGNQRKDLDRLGVEWHSVASKLEWMEDPWRDVDSTGEWLRALAAEHEPDLVHLNSYSHGAPRWDVPVLVTAHSCVLSWWKDVKGELPPPRLRRYRERVGAGLAEADLVTAPTRSLLRDIQTFYGRNNASKVIANGSAVSETLGSNEALIVTAGRMWDEAKNLEALDAAAPRVRWPIIACGRGSERARHLEGSGAVPRGELLETFARAAIFCAPARYEPFGLSALEAARCGCALVLGDISSLREVWQDAAVFVSPEDADEIAAALNRLSSDPAELAGAAHRARERAATFTVGRMAGAYLQSYRTLAERRAAAGEAGT